MTDPMDPQDWTRKARALLNTLTRNGDTIGNTQLASELAGAEIDWDALGVDEIKSPPSPEEISRGLRSGPPCVDARPNPMSREQHLLTCLAEECAEVAQRATKALRFGMQERQPMQDWTNRERLEHELGDLMGVADMLGIKPHPGMRAKKARRVETYLAYSRKLGLAK